MMYDFGVKHLPVVKDSTLLGIINEDDIFDNDVELELGSYQFHGNLPKLYSSDHIYEAMRLLYEHNLTIIPVVDPETEDYLGLISMEDLLKFFAGVGAFHEPGSIIVLEIARKDYILSEIARIVESENSVILSTFLTTTRDSEKIEVTLKINRQDPISIIATFERYDY